MTPERCAPAPELQGMVIHRFAPGARTCQCGEQVIEEPRGRNNKRWLHHKTRAAPAP